MTDIRAVMVTMAIIGFQFATPVLRGILQGAEDFGRYASSIVVESAGKAIVGIALVYAGFGVTGAFLGWLAGALLAFVYTLIIVLLRYGRPPGAPLRVDAQRLVRTTASIAAATLLLTTIGYSDVIVVKHFADPTTAGLYGALSLTGKILLFFVAFVPTVVLPKATRQALSGASPVGVFAQALALIGALSGAGLLVFFFFPAKIVTTLAGVPFAPAAPYVFAYGVAMVLLAGLNVVAVYKIGIHRFDFVVPLALCTVGEIAGICVYHRSLSQVIAVLIACYGIAFAASCYRVTAPLASRTRASVASAPDAA